MGTNRIWQGVRLRQVEAGADPESPHHVVSLPAAWDDAAAAAICMLTPTTGRISLLVLAQNWMQPLAARAVAAGLNDLPDQLYTLLLLRRGAPSVGIWRGAADDAPGFLLNLPAFYESATGFDTAEFANAVTTAARTMQLLAPQAAKVAIAMSDLAGLLALLGVDYASQSARDIAACLAAVLRGCAEVAMAGLQPDLLARVVDWPEPPARCAIDGLAHAAASARAEALRFGTPLSCTAILPPGPVDALLGVETGGIAPAFAAVGSGGLTSTARAWLTATGVTLEAALAATLAQEPVFPVVGPAEHIAMHDTVGAIIHAMPPRPVPTPQRAVATQQEQLPANRRDFTRKVAIGGHRLFLRTSEYADGRLGEIGITLPRETATVRGLAESFAAAVSLGLQHGVPLERFVDLFTGLACFAPAGVVGGDPMVERAGSIPDYVARSLAATYLGRIVPKHDEPIPAPALTPLLPLNLPSCGRRRDGLRLVA